MNSIQDVAMLILGLAVVGVAAFLFSSENARLGDKGKSVKQSLIDLSGNVLNVEGWDLDVGNGSGNGNDGDARNV